MPAALRQVLCEELAGGFFKFIDTGVEIGSNGISGLIQHLPLVDSWGFTQPAGGHQFSTELDVTYSRQVHRVTSVLAGAQSSSIFCRLLLPRDFGSFPANAISLIIYASDITGPTLAASLLQDGLPDLDAVDILPAAAGAYYLVELTPTWIYAPGDELLLQIDFASDAAAQYADVSDLAIAYTTARGNV